MPIIDDDTHQRIDRLTPYLNRLMAGEDLDAVIEDAGEDLAEDLTDMKQAIDIGRTAGEEDIDLKSLEVPASACISLKDLCPECQERFKEADFVVA